MRPIIKLATQTDAYIIAQARNHIHRNFRYKIQKPPLAILIQQNPAEKFDFAILCYPLQSIYGKSLIKRDRA